MTDLVNSDPSSGPGHVEQSLQSSETGNDVLHLVPRVWRAEEFHADPWKKNDTMLRTREAAGFTSFSPSIRCSRSELRSSGLLAPPAEEVCPIEVGVAGLDRLAGASSDTTKPIKENPKSIKHQDEPGGGAGGAALTVTVEPQGGGVQDGSPGRAVMSPGLIRHLCRVERAS